MGRRVLTGLVVAAAALLFATLAQGGGSRIVRATSLPSMSRFDGRQSIDDTVLTRLVHDTISPLGKATRVAVACWDERDWTTIAAPTAAPDARGRFVAGLFLPAMPHWIHL